MFKLKAIKVPKIAKQESLQQQTKPPTKILSLERSAFKTRHMPDIFTNPNNNIVELTTFLPHIFSQQWEHQSIILLTFICAHAFVYGCHH